MKVLLKGCSRFAGVLMSMTVLAGPGIAQVQEPTTGTAPPLRDFELKGKVTVPAPPPSAAPVETPPPVTITPPPATTTRTPPADPAPGPTERQAAPAPSAPSRSVARPRTNVPEPAPPAPSPGPVAPQVEVDALPATDAPRPRQPEPSTGPAAAPQSGEFPWLYLVLGMLAAVAALAAGRVLLRRRADEDEVEEPLPVESASEPRPQPQPAPAVKPVPRPQPAPVAQPSSGRISTGTVGIQVRPWIELEFKPDRAVATDADTSVQFELIVRNTGNTGARNVRIEGRMFNAGREEEREVGAFFSEPLMINCAAIPMLLPQGTGAIRSVVSMPRTEVKEITLEGRRLFVPMVAFNVTYEWGENRSGQTSMSYLVGRESEAPSEKMGAFRLDLGPRLYRSVGHRQTNLALVV